MDPMGLVEIEQARIARFEAERIADEEAAAQAVLDAVPTDEELAARDLQQRRDAAYDEGVMADLDAAALACNGLYVDAEAAFRKVGADPKSSNSDLWARWSDLIVAHAVYEASVEQVNTIQGRPRRIVPAGLAALAFAEAQEQVLKLRATNAARTRGHEIAQAAQDAGGVAAAKVK